MGTKTELWCMRWAGFSPLCLVAGDWALVPSRGAHRRPKLILSRDPRPAYFGECNKVSHSRARLTWAPVTLPVIACLPACPVCPATPWPTAAPDLGIHSQSLGMGQWDMTQPRAGTGELKLAAWANAVVQCPSSGKGIWGLEKGAQDLGGWIPESNPCR